MQSWNDYLETMIDYTRKELDNYRIYHPEIPEEASHANMLYGSFPKPCQIKVFEFVSTHVFWILNFEPEKKDKNFTIYTNIKEEIADFSKSCKDFPKGLEEFYSDITSIREFTLTSLNLSIYLKSREPPEYVYLFLKNPRKEFKPIEIAKILFERLKPFLLLNISKNQVKNATRTMEQQISTLKEVPARSELLKSLEKIETSVKKTDELHEELIGVRKLIGASEEFKDWKILVSDVDKLRKEHVAKGEFDAKIERLDEKIEKGLEALNTRIEDLKAIKFWSKRTLLEIALTIWAAILTLYVAGILKF